MAEARKILRLETGEIKFVRQDRSRLPKIPQHVLRDREIRKFQKKTELLIPRAAFQRVAKELLAELMPSGRFSFEAVSALQEASDIYLVELLRDTALCARKRVTITVDDMNLARRIRGESV